MVNAVTTELSHSESVVSEICGVTAKAFLRAQLDTGMLADIRNAVTADSRWPAFCRIAQTRPIKTHNALESLVVLWAKKYRSSFETSLQLVCLSDAARVFALFVSDVSRRPGDATRRMVDGVTACEFNKHLVMEATQETLSAIVGTLPCEPCSVGSMNSKRLNFCDHKRSWSKGKPRRPAFTLLVCTGRTRVVEFRWRAARRIQRNPIRTASKTRGDVEMSKADAAKTERLQSQVKGSRLRNESLAAEVETMTWHVEEEYKHISAVKELRDFCELTGTSLSVEMLTEVLSSGAIAHALLMPAS